MTTPEMEEVVERLSKVAFEAGSLDTKPQRAALRKDLRALLFERRKMVEALTRQTDNMAFVLNRVELPPAWLEKFDRELAEDRAALTGSRERD